MIHNQTFRDAEDAILRHERICTFCGELGFVNRFVCPTRLALVDAASAIITPEQEAKQMANYDKLYGYQTPAEKLEATFE
jgi:hypothetical protein